MDIILLLIQLKFKYQLKYYVENFETEWLQNISFWFDTDWIKFGPSVRLLLHIF